MGMWELENRRFFICRLAMAAYIQITGWTQKTNRDGEIKWRHTLLTNRAADEEKRTGIIEARGVPLGYRSWQALGAMMRPFRMLRKILSEGITTADPNITIMEVAGLATCPPLHVSKIGSPEGLFTV